MAQIDALLSHLINTDTSRAILRGDTPSQLESAYGVSEGSVVSNVTLEDIFLEIAPISACEAIKDTNTADFQYNGFDFHVTIENDILTFIISPIVTAPAPVATPIVSHPVAEDFEYQSPFTETPSFAPAPPEHEGTTSYQEPTYAPPAYQQQPPTHIGAGGFSSNNSGQGADSTLPPEIRGFNWGAFLLPFFWTVSHSTWIGLLIFVPCVGTIMHFMLGFKGNEWAWQNRRFESVAQFKQVQKTWAIAGVAYTIVVAIFALPIYLPLLGHGRASARRASCQTNLKQISLGVYAYSQAHGNRFPTSTSDEQFKRDLQPYIKNMAAFECSEDSATGTSDYVYNKQLAGMNYNDLSDPFNTPMLWDKGGIGHLQGRNIAFADGHIMWYKESVFQAWIAPYRVK